MIPDHKHCIYAYCMLTGISVRFTQDRFFGSETEGFMLVSLELVGGTVSIPFNVTITPSEQLPVSAEGNSVLSFMIIIILFDQQVILTLTHPDWLLHLMLE